MAKRSANSACVNHGTSLAKTSEMPEIKSYPANSYLF